MRPPEDPRIRSSGRGVRQQTFKVDATPEDLACAVLRPVKVVEDPAAYQGHPH